MFKPFPLSLLAGGGGEGNVEGNTTRRELPMFQVDGFARDDDRAVSVVWRAPGERGRGPDDRRLEPLDGDEKIVVQGIVDAAMRRRYAATPTGPDLVVDLDDAPSVLLAFGERLQLAYTVTGDYEAERVYPVPPGAEA